MREIIYGLIAVVIISTPVFAIEKNNKKAEVTKNNIISSDEKPDSPIFNTAEEAAASCTCTYKEQTYEKGATVCMGKKKMECGCGGWYKIDDCK